jgi:hypothetical protein
MDCEDTIMKNIIITRMNLQWNKQLTDNFVSETITRMNTINRASLKNQSCQDFTLLTLTDEKMSDFGDVLENEIIIKVPSLNGGYNHEGIIEAVKKYVSSLDCKAVITTRLDTDDALHKHFIKNLKNIKLAINNYADTVSGFPCLNIKTGETITSKKHPNWFTSQFVSFHENVKGFKCVVYEHSHAKVGQHYKGFHYDELKVLQVIHGKNHSTKIYTEGQKVNINLQDYGLWHI